jgi:hypothetical protein
MPDQFLLAEPDERRDVYAVAAAGTGLPPKILEKDVWLCWTLDMLFSQDGRPQMAFKGGTSLSKVYGVIDRFSEDIDLTIALDPDANAGLPSSTSAAKKARERLGAQLKSHLQEVVVPLVSSALAPYVDDPSECVTMLDDETVVLGYPSCFAKEGGYLAERVRMEFGARNRIVPSESRVITPYVTDFLIAEEVELPLATAAQNRTRYSRLAIVGRPGEGTWFRPSGTCFCGRPEPIAPPPAQGVATTGWSGSSPAHLTSEVTASLTG